MKVLLASFQARYGKNGFADVDGQNESLKGLMDILGQDHQLSIWTPEPKDPQWRGIMRVHELIEEIKNKKPDLVHLFLPTPNFHFIADMVDKKTEPPLVTRYNSSLIKDIPPTPRDLYDLKWLSEKLIINNQLNGKISSKLTLSDDDRKTIVSTEFQKRELVDILGSDPSQIEIIPNTSRSKIYVKRNTIKKKNSKKIRFGYMGHFTLAKGVEGLLETFSKLEENTELILALSGRGKDVDKISYYKNKKNIRLRGVVEKEKFFQEIDVMVLPYRCSFGTQIIPNTLLEARCAGIPIITSKLPYMEEVLTHEKDALLFEPNEMEDLKEQMERLCRDPSLKEKLSVQKIPDELRPENVKEKLEELYVDMVS